MNHSHLLWPALPYEEFKLTSHLLHMSLQVIGKLKLVMPFEPHWAHVALWLTSRGLTTGVLPYKEGSFSVDVDFIAHEVLCTTSLGAKKKFALTSMSVAKFTDTLLSALHHMGIDVSINLKPQEVPNPIDFNLDTREQGYNADLINAWWRIMLSSYHVMQRYHALYTGYTPPIGLMWGTLDLRDARYIETPVPNKPSTDFITRNAMDVAQVEAGWWGGSDDYPKAAYFSFTYPQPPSIEHSKTMPEAAYWNAEKREFILDYDVIRQSNDPDSDLFAFLQSTYQVGTHLAGWSSTLICDGKPK